MEKSTLFQKNSTLKFQKRENLISTWYYKLLFLFILSSLSISGFAQQIQQYKAVPNATTGTTVNAPTKTYKVIAGTTGATLLYGSASTYSYPSYNDLYSFKIPFDFKYGTQTLTANSSYIYVSPGWNYVSFGAVPSGNGSYPITSYGQYYYQPFYNTSYYAKNSVSPYGGNYNTESYRFAYAYNSGDNNPARGVWYKVEGTAPNRVLIIEFFKFGNYYWEYGNNLTTSSYYNNYRSCQVKIYETTDKIEFHYGPRNTGYYTNTGYHYTFLMGNTYSDCQIMYGTNSGSSHWDSPYRYTGTANGYLNSTSYSHINYAYWTEGKYYEFTPNTPSNLTINNQTATALDLSWTPSSFGESTWSLEYGPQGFLPGNGTVVTSSVNNNFSLPLTGLLPATDYDVYVYAYNQGVYGEPNASIKASFTTPCPSSYDVSNPETFQNYSISEVNDCWIDILDSLAVTMAATGNIIGYDTSYVYHYDPVATITDTYTFSYNGTDGTNGSAQTWVVPAGAMTATFEVWGAEGGYYNTYYLSGKGGYASGQMNMEDKIGNTFYVMVGGKGIYYGNGNTTYSGGGFNGGGGTAYGYGGGGGTDIRTVDGELKSRFIVAGGGGGASGYPQSSYYTYNNYRADGGGTDGRTGYSNSSSYYVYGASQTSGGGNGSTYWNYGEVGQFGRG